MTDAGGDGPATIPAAVAATATSYGDRIAVDDGDVRLTYADLADQAGTFAAALVASGVTPGDRVAIWAGNRVEWIVAVLGVFEAGAVLVPVNTRFKGAEAADVLTRSRARCLVTVTDFLDTDYVGLLAATGAELPDLTTTVLVGSPARSGDRSTDPSADGRAQPPPAEEDGSSSSAPSSGWSSSEVDWADFLARATPGSRAEAARRSAALTADDPSDILFTSGTTGMPKGVVQTHGRTLRVATDWVAMTGLSAGDRYLMINPYFHMFGLKAGILASVVAGATMLPQAVFDVGRVLERVAAEQVTVLPGAPTIYQSILDHPDRDRHDLSSLRVAVTGAADIPVELIRRIDRELPFSVIITGYGLTEGGTAAATSPGDDVETIAMTVGRPRPGFELRIVDDRGAEVPHGQAGELLLRGGSIMSHYLDDPEATAAAVSDDGWLRTGDLGVLDDAGNLRIVGRSKDMFIVGGFNAYPAEIENVLLRHPAVQQAAVIGVPDDRLGEVGMAFVVLAPGSSTSGAEIIEWSRDEMANYKVPRRVEVVSDLPVNATGKVVKDDLRARAAGSAPSAG